jgi:hypothetical protein
MFPEKALTIAGADRFNRRRDTYGLHTMSMNQLCVNWEHQEDLSSTAAFRLILDRQSASIGPFSGLPGAA